MKVNDRYLRKMYVAFGYKARDDIHRCVDKIIDALEMMTENDRNATLEVLDPEVKKAIVDD